MVVVVVVVVNECVFTANIFAKRKTHQKFNASDAFELL